MLRVLVVGSEQHRKHNAVERRNQLGVGFKALQRGRRHSVLSPDPRLRALDRVRESLWGIHETYPARASLVSDRACLGKARREVFAQRVRKQENNRRYAVKGRCRLSRLVNHDPLSNIGAQAPELVEKGLQVARMPTPTPTVSD